MLGGGILTLLLVALGSAVIDLTTVVLFFYGFITSVVARLPLASSSRSPPSASCSPARSGPSR